MPAALFVANENQAGSRKRDGAEIEVAMQQAEPTHVGRHAVRAKKIFVAEGGVFTDAYAFHIDAGEWEDVHRKASSFHWTAEGFFEVREEIRAHPAGLQEEGKAELRQNQ